MGKGFFVGKQQWEGELAGGVCKGRGSSWVMLKVNGERAELGPRLHSRLPGDAQSVAPSAEPGPELCSRRRGAGAFMEAGNAF